MFGKNSADRIASLVALLAVAGVSVAEGAPLPTPEAFGAHLAERTKAAVDEAVSKVTASLATANAAMGTATASVGAFSAGLAAAGVKLGDFKAEDFQPAKDAKQGDLTPAAAAVKTAVETSIAAKSAKQIAGAGHPQTALEVAKTDEIAAEQTSAELFTEFNAITDPAKRAAFFAKHEKKLLG